MPLTIGLQDRVSDSNTSYSSILEVQIVVCTEDSSAAAIESTFE